MEAEQMKQLEQINQTQNKLTNALNDYWFQYTNINSWQFWFFVGVLVLSLLILYLCMDRSKALLLGFFGFNVHVWFTKLDSSFQAFGLWYLPHEMIPFIKAFALDAAFVPVSFMLLYQWTLNHKKNYYLYATGLCLILSFLWTPLLSVLGVFQMDKGINYFYLFVGYISVILVSKWITNVFVHFQKEAKSLN